MYGISFVHRYIRPAESGRLLEKKVKGAGFTVKDIQMFLGLSCPQPIYRWFKGFALPSLDNLYSLSCLFNVHMDQLIVPMYFEHCDSDEFDSEEQKNRLLKYAEMV